MTIKEKKIEELFLKLKKDRKLPLAGDFVLSSGSCNSKIVFIGEAPGAKEIELGLPFVGHSGKLIDKSLLEINLSRASVYITNIIKRRPADNRDPKAYELQAYRSYLERELEIIKPELVVTLGRFALNYFLPEAKITHCQGKIIKVNNFNLLPVFHPAATFRKKETLVQFRKSFKEIAKFIENKKKC